MTILWWHWLVFGLVLVAGEVTVFRAILWPRLASAPRIRV